MGDTVRTLQRDGQIYLRVDGGIVVTLAAVGVVVEREGILCVLTLARHRQCGGTAVVVGDGQIVSAKLLTADPDRIRNTLSGADAEILFCGVVQGGGLVCSVLGGCPCVPLGITGGESTGYCPCTAHGSDRTVRDVQSLVGTDTVAAATDQGILNRLAAVNLSLCGTAYSSHYTARNAHITAGNSDAVAVSTVCIATRGGDIAACDAHMTAGINAAADAIVLITEDRHRAARCCDIAACDTHTAAIGIDAIAAAAIHCRATCSDYSAVCDAHTALIGKNATALSEVLKTIDDRIRHTTPDSQRTTAADGQICPICIDAVAVESHRVSAVGDTVRTLQRDGQIYLRVDGGIVVTLAAVGVVVEREGILCVLTLARHRQCGGTAVVVGDGQIVSAKLLTADPDRIRNTLSGADAEILFCGVVQGGGLVCSVLGGCPCIPLGISDRERPIFVIDTVAIKVCCIALGGNTAACNVYIAFRTDTVAVATTRIIL